MLALWLLGCAPLRGTQPWDPAQVVVLEGSALAEDGSPLASVELTLGLYGGFCLEPPLSLSAERTVSTDAKGHFSVTLTHAEFFNDAAHLLTCAQLVLRRPDRPEVHTWLAFNNIDPWLLRVVLPVPPLKEWSGSPGLTGDGRVTEVRLEDLTVTQPDAQVQSYRADLLSGGLRVWSAEELPSPVWVFSTVLMEDFPALAAEVWAVHSGASGDLVFTTAQRSQSVPLTGPNLRPTSRGAACGYAGAPAVCALTDGKLESVEFRPAVSELTLDLGQREALTRIDVRGLSYFPPAPDAFPFGEEVVAEGDADGGWARLSSARVRGADLTMSLPPSADGWQSVRLHWVTLGGNPVVVNALQEVSLWTTTP